MLLPNRKGSVCEVDEDILGPRGWVRVNLARSLEFAAMYHTKRMPKKTYAPVTPSNGDVRSQSVE